MSITSPLHIIDDDLPIPQYDGNVSIDSTMSDIESEHNCTNWPWDRKNKGLEKVIKMDGYQIGKNVLQRSGISSFFLKKQLRLDQMIDLGLTMRLKC
jgi:hypothetical protein